MTMPASQNLSIVVDLRSQWKYVRDQGGRNSCLACASSDAHMHAQKLDHPLSAEYLFFQAARFMPGNDVSKGLTFQAAQSALRDHGQPHEDEWPYQMVEPHPWLPPAVTTIWSADLKLDPAQEISTVISKIKSGSPVILAIRLNAEFLNVHGPLYRISSSGPGFGGHVVVAVGLGVDSLAGGEEFLLVRNSWGQGWGVAGHAWLPTQYLADKMIGFGTTVPRI
jgi:C1A family cysteine protease